MHGQKKRRKRSIAGTALLDGLNLNWELVSEPQWSNGDGWIGLRLSVDVAEAAKRKLIVEYPYPTDKLGRKLLPPQRPNVTQAMVERSIRDALADGWDPGSRGKPYFYRVPA
jgi:hypothetical protein